MPQRHNAIRTAATLAAFALNALAAAQIQFTHVTLEPGGHLSSSGGDITMSVILGEPDAATASSGSLTLRSGFLPLVTPHPCPGDATGDNLVDFNDLNLLLANWGATVTPGTNGDLDADGMVTFTDLNLLLEEWGADCA